MATSRRLGTLGELWQGPYQSDDSRLHVGLVALPCSRYSSEITVEFGKSDQSPPYKSYQAIEKIISHFSLDVRPSELRWVRHSNIPVSKGMASSTADVVATIDAMSLLFNLDISCEQTMDLLRGIERSDPVFSDQPGLYLSKDQSFVCKWDWKPAFDAVYAILPGETNTESKDEAALLDFYDSHLSEYGSSFQRISEGFSARNVCILAEGSTSCAQIFQYYDHIPLVDGLLEASNRLNSLGVIRAYTGRVAGLLFPYGALTVRSDFTEIASVFRQFGTTPLVDRVGYEGL